MSGPQEPPKQCPDNGVCHHLCGTGPCYRVLWCGPLSAAGYPGNDWPEQIKIQNYTKHVAREVAKQLDKLGAQVRAADGGHVIAETMAGGSVIFFEIEGEPFAINVFSMKHQDEGGPLFFYEPSPEWRIG